MEVVVEYKGQSTKIKGDEVGPTVEDVAKTLPTDVAITFAYIARLIQEEPDNIKRNWRYAKIADKEQKRMRKEYKEASKENDIFRIFMYGNWRKTGEEIVMLADLPDELMDKLGNIRLRFWKGGRNGYSGFSGFTGSWSSYGLKNEHVLYVINVIPKITQDGRVVLNEWDDNVIDTQENEI